MDSNISRYASRRRFNLLINFLYLISFSLIGAGLYINYQDQLNTLGNQGLNTEYNNYDLADIYGVQDTVRATPLTTADLSMRIERLSPATRDIIAKLDDSLSIVSSSNNPPITLNVSNKTSIDKLLAGQRRRLTMAQREVFDSDLQKIIKVYNKLQQLNADQTVSVIVDSDSGHINYLTYLYTPKNEVVISRYGDKFYKEENVKKSTFKAEVIGLRISATLENTLKNNGISNADISNIIKHLQWKNKSVPAGSVIRIYVSREYVGNQLVSPKIFGVKGFELNGVYGIKYTNNLWYDEQGFRETIASFNRYPFAGNTPPITSRFNPARRNPVTGRVSPHNGVDFGLPRGTPLVAPGPGVVAKVSYQANGAGNYLIIQHTSSFSTVYMHLTHATVRVGQRVNKGDRIAFSGNTGRSTGPHLHYETHVNGVPVNPERVALPSGTSTNKNNDRGFRSYAADVKRGLDNYRFRR